MYIMTVLRALASVLAVLIGSLSPDVKVVCNLYHVINRPKKVTPVITNIAALFQGYNNNLLVISNYEQDDCFLELSTYLFIVFN